jgi:hypothetical protein
MSGMSPEVNVAIARDETYKEILEHKLVFNEPGSSTTHSRHGLAEKKPTSPAAQCHLLKRLLVW